LGGWTLLFLLCLVSSPPLPSPTSLPLETTQVALGGGLLLGWGGLNLLASMTSASQPSSSKGSRSSEWYESAGMRGGRDDEDGEDAAAAAAAREAAAAAERELRLFDEQLRRRERQR